MDIYKVTIQLWLENSYTDNGDPDESRVVEVNARSPQTAEALAVAQIDAASGPYYEMSAST